MNWKAKLLFVGCAYELVALSSRLPTITDLTHRWGRLHPLTRATVWLWCGYVAYHFMVEDNEATTAA